MSEDVDELLSEWQGDGLDGCACGLCKCELASSLTRRMLELCIEAGRKRSLKSMHKVVRDKSPSPIAYKTYYDRVRECQPELYEQWKVLPR